MHRVLQIIGRGAAILGAVLLALVIVLFSAMTVVCLGPSTQARDLFVNTVMETSAAKFLAYIYFSPEEIEAIKARNNAIEIDDVTKPIEKFESSDSTEETPEIEIVDILGDTFKGKLMIVRDPSRVSVGTPTNLGPEYQGWTLDKLVERNGAIAGINAGGFVDENGFGNGGTPVGIVIRDGELVFGSPTYTGTVIGFDTEHRLIVGRMSAAKALERNIRDAVTFGPALVMNGEAVPISGSGGGLNPRTCIGQRADGAVLLLTIDGRQSHSLGASYKDCARVMLEHGAINAANLDGGSSTLMIYNGEHVNKCATLYGSRDMPTSFIVR